ncbi:OmpA family protein [uncultured Rikenella sp.]|uniref:OmpA/MotB family protein n=1 Tax=uncultured Rikenella sp. TaxID=368003 RepID=UPI0026177E79|nr:OmpA family protein [uncultured Rikenella sp.]
MKTGKIVGLVCTAGFVLAGAVSCVSMKTYRQTQTRALRCEHNSAALLAEVEQLREQRAALEAQYGALDSAHYAGGLTNAELRALLRERTQVLAEVRALLGEALQDFDSEGLSVTERGGMIYVSVDEKLLFELGKAEVSQEGERAVLKVGEVLARNPNIRIMVEGHTDNLPYRSKEGDQIVDNWDLSVHRATAVVRILLRNEGIAPKRVTAAGRSQYVPVAEGTGREARARNRRTEIILTPDMDRLMELLGQAGRIADNAN